MLIHCSETIGRGQLSIEQEYTDHIANRVVIPGPKGLGILVNYLSNDPSENGGNLG